MSIDSETALKRANKAGSANANDAGLTAQFCNIAANVLTVASAAGMAITSLRMATLRRQLHTDPLTGLANRSGLYRAYASSRVGSGHCLGVLMLDIDNFKAINDTYGHRVGDQVLAEVGRRLRLHQRRGELAVRLSGDEFALWLGVFADSADSRLRIDELAADVAASIAAPMFVNDQVIAVSASVGVGIIVGKPAALEDLLEYADLAMYDIKGRRRRDLRMNLKANSFAGEVGGRATS